MLPRVATTKTTILATPGQAQPYRRLPNPKTPQPRKNHAPIPDNSLILLKTNLQKPELPEITRAFPDAPVDAAKPLAILYLQTLPPQPSFSASSGFPPYPTVTRPLPSTPVQANDKIESLQMSCKKLLLASLALSTFSLFAQSESATLSGTVHDPSQQLVAAAVIDVENKATQLTRKVESNAEGFFVLPFLPPGEYRIRASKPGFATAEIASFSLNVNDRRNIEIKLALAQGSDAVTVSERLVSTIQETATIGTLVDQKFVENLPLNGRSFQNLIALTPGVTQAPANLRNPGQFAVNGQRTATNYYTVDGVSANFGVMPGPQLAVATDGVLPAYNVAGGTNSLVSVDAMQEFQVQTSGFAPEFGRSPGGQVAIVTRSGSNGFHGSLYNYFRNDKLDANDWFANRDGLPRAPVRQNNFGVVAGAPVHIPRLYNGANRTFFFASYEGLRLRQPRFATDTYPSLASRARASAANRPLVNAFPIPNQGDVAGGFGRFSATYSDPLTLDAGSLRVDHVFSPKLTLFGRYTQSPSEWRIRGPIQTYDLGLNTININDSNSRTLTFGSTQVFTPALLNELRFNYSRNSGAFRTTMDNFGGATVLEDSFLFPSFTNRNVASAGILPAGVRGFAVGALADNAQSQLNLVSNLSFSRSTHHYKMGVDWRRLTPEVTAPLYQQFGIFAGLDGPVGLLTGRTAGALVGAFDGMRAALSNFSWYVQDTWRPTARLSLTYGLRWDYNPPPVALDGRTIYTAIGVDNPRTARLAPAGTKLFDATRTAFAPRVGISYLLRNTTGWETTVRGGWGLFNDLPLGMLQAATGNPPYRRSARLAGTTYPLPPAQAQPLPITTEGRFDLIYAFAPDFKQPYVHQFNLTLEQGLGRSRSVSASYVGAVGRRLSRRETYAEPRAQATFDTLNILRSAATSDYHALQLQYVQRLKAGLQVLVSHTYSHSIDSNSDNVALVLPAALSNTALNRGSSDFDVRQLFSGAVTYDLPFRYLRGWGLDSVFRAQSAFPIDVFRRQATILGNYDLRPNLVPGQPLYLESPNFAGGRQLNPAAFSTPTGQTVHGNLGRNVLRAFPLKQIDFTVRRQFRLTERANLQFRAEMFNVLNHPSFANPDGNLANPLFGRSLSLFGRGLGLGGPSGGQNPLYSVGTPRSVQLALRLRW